MQFFWPALSDNRSFVDLLCFSVLCLLCLCTRLFICALWSPAGKGLTSWLSFLVSNCEFVTFPLVSWVRWGTWLYRFLIFAPLLTLKTFLVFLRVTAFHRFYCKSWVIEIYGTSWNMVGWCLVWNELLSVGGVFLGLKFPKIDVIFHLFSVNDKVLFTGLPLNIHFKIPWLFTDFSLTFNRFPDPFGRPILAIFIHRLFEDFA